MTEIANHNQKSLADLPSLRGSVAVITGGASDIAQAVARDLIENEVTVVLADVDSNRMEAFASEARHLGGRAIPIDVDLSDSDACTNLIDQVWEGVGPIRTLVNAAAITHRGRIHEIPADAWDQIVAVNLSAPYRTCRTAIEHMVGFSGGVLINIASIAGVRGLPGSPIYAATKGGLVALSRALAIDYAIDGIRVHAVTPPAVDTRALSGLFEGSKPQEAKAAYEETQPAGRMLKIAEVAALIGYLIEGNGPIYSAEPLVF